MNPRAAELVRLLQLQPHPEGGFYREIWRSSARVQTADRPERSAVTTIYFLLAAGGFSAWHRVRSRHWRTMHRNGWHCASHGVQGAARAFPARQC
jgi:predicted cupin superfamily sugar epimerase